VLLNMRPAASAHTFVLLKERLVRLLRRIAIEIEASDNTPSPALVIDLCTSNTLRHCKSKARSHLSR